MARECQEKNAKGLTMVAVGVNKSAEQYMILDERTREDLASGKYHDQRRGTFGPVSSSGAGPAGAPVGAAPADTAPADTAPAGAAPAGAAPADTAPVGAAPADTAPAGAARPARPPVAPARRAPARRPAPRPWTPSQEKLALLYNEQGLRPDQIAERLRLSTYLVTQIILASRSRGKL
jgi:hypothetical protein